MKKTPRTKESDDGLSKNNGKKIKYRIRVQQEVEAEQDINDFIKQELDRAKRLSGPPERKPECWLRIAI